ncbi:hypothetical protein TRFO_08714 [Tritrichomonas foetus]|uniref:Uncharacterized protein n=1 Tax=Tritrichomonas foetus TaxID=1144522 RepID=A0A1J4JJE2_9EUKA|nr:hypothetical protein TRFO_08714 [Tritrichomonas foetus]|eukprot:OHS98721.1 hypothetical protein TRFO_08714 [Tritrichomonas foetus]
MGEVLEILYKNLELRRDQENDVPFSSLDNATLRTIEAYIKHAKEKEPAVRRMYQNETIPAEKQLEILKAELDRVDDQLRLKKASNSSSEFTSENDTTDDTSGESDSTASSSSESSEGSSDSDTGED